ncbi:TPA: tyrosine-type recombinase/integrase [Yersinia enterocolitica]
MKLPTGVEIRNKKICVWFFYRGKRRREVLKGWINSPSNIKKAGNLRAAIVSEITFGNFDYYTKFPESKFVEKSNKTIKITTFQELTLEWIKSKTAELTANTLKKTNSQIKTLIHIIGNETPITSIRHNDIMSYRHELLHGKTLYSEKKRSNKIGRTVRTVDNYISLLCSMLRYAYFSKCITDKPFEGIKKLPKNRIRPDPLSKEEFRKLVGSLHGQSRNMWQLAIYTGIRHGELCALAWEDIDLVAGTIKIRRNLTTMNLFVPPKTKAGFRTITLLSPALEALKDQFNLTAQQPLSEITFHYREYGKTDKQHLRFVFIPRVAMGVQKPHFFRTSIGHRWNAIIKRTGIRPRNPYHTRHTYACWLLSAGANPAFIASQMGHENAQMVFEVYGAWMDEMNSDQISLLNSKLAI